MSEIRLVEKRYAGKGFIPGLFHMLSWLGRSKGLGPYDFYYSDGYVFRPYAVGMSRPEDLAARGCSDPTGAKFQKYVDAAGLGYMPNGKKLRPGHYVNWLELDHN